MKRFSHLDADSLETATAALSEHGKKARLIAGGTDLLGEMQDAILPDYPEVIVNLKSIPGLDYLREEDGKLHIGALTRLEDIANSELVQQKYPLLAEASCRTASPHIREMGTVGGNICQSNRCWYYWVPDNRFDCLRKGGPACHAVIGDARYHSIFGSTRVSDTPCTAACPASINIPDYMDLIRKNDITAAARLLLEANPLPSITGRVCPHFCQEKCNRATYDETVSVRSVERFLGDYVLDHPDLLAGPATTTGKKIAVIGSGPTGLSAAMSLNRLGHAVTIYEKKGRAGGLLAHGIPPYRLPKDIVARQVEVAEKAGMEIKTGAGDIEPAALAPEYDAVLVACGAGRKVASGIEGEELLVSGIEFLAKVNGGETTVPGANVAVLGGGNVAIDVARTLLRLGAKPIILYRRGRDEMPALPEETAAAEEEGIAFRFLVSPLSAKEADGGVALTCIGMKLGAPDESGRPRPEPLPGSETTDRYDTVIEALGERPDLSIVPAEYVNAEGRLLIEGTSAHLGGNLFAAGDFVTGPSTVIQSIAAGRAAAAAINAYLSGPETPSDHDRSDAPVTFDTDFLGKTPRVHAPRTPASERVRHLEGEDVGGLTDETVRAEAGRCFNCGCIAVNPSDMAPALIAIGAEVRTTARTIPAGEFFAVNGERTTVLGDNEIVVEIIVPGPVTGTRNRFLKSAIRKSIDFPLVNCAASIHTEHGAVTEARICLNSVYTMPYRVTAAETYLKGKSIDEATAAAAADLLTGETMVLPANRYKVQIARALVKRVIMDCAETSR